MTLLSERTYALCGRCHQSLKITDFGEGKIMLPNQQYLPYEKELWRLKPILSLSVSRQMPQNLQKQLVMRERWMDVSSINFAIWVIENPEI